MDAVLISAWNAQVNHFFPVFTRPSARIFANLLTGWVLCIGRHTLTGMIRRADPDGFRAHDAYHRLLRDGVWSMDELWRRLTVLLVRRFWPTGTIRIDLDDTLFHRSGRKVEGAGWWRDAVRSTAHRIVYAWGLNLVVVTLEVTPPWGGGPLGLPILMRVHRKGGSTLIELATRMLRQIRQWLPERTFLVCADGFYASLTGAGIPGVHMISRLRRDAEIYELPPQRRPHQQGRSRKRGRRLPPPGKMARQVKHFRKVKTNQRGTRRYRWTYVRTVLWYHVSKDQPMRLVISRDLEGIEKDDFFITTDLSLTAAEVISQYSGRWAIEETFKQTKQVLSGHQVQSWKRQGPQRAAAMSLWLYSMVWLWYLQLRPSRWTFLAQPWYPAKTAPSFADALTRLRGALWEHRIKLMFGIRAVHDKKYRFIIESLAEAA